MNANQKAKSEKRAAAGGPGGKRRQGAAAEKEKSPPQDDRLAGSARPKQPETKVSLKDLFPPTLKESWKSEADAHQAKNIALAREAYIRRGLVLYMGAGVSCSVGLPTWWEMIRSLTLTMMTERVDSALAALRDLSDEEIAMAKLSIQKEVSEGTDANKSILIMARSIKDFFGERLPYELAQVLYGALSKTSGLLGLIEAFLLRPKKRPTKSLKQYRSLENSKLFGAIVQLARAQRDVRGVQVIVNFNYDDLIEEWMREHGIRCDTILSGKEMSRDASLPCYHVHGVLPFHRVHELEPTKNRDLSDIIGNFVFSEDEYHTEYSDAYRWSNMTMMNQLNRYSGLFVGLSMQDPNLRRLIDVTHRQYPDIINYAILTRKEPRHDSGDPKQSMLRDLFERVETESFENIGVRVIWTDNFEEVPDRILDICNIDAPGHEQ